MGAHRLRRRVARSDASSFRGAPGAEPGRHPLPDRDSAGRHAQPRTPHVRGDLLRSHRARGTHALVRRDAPADVRVARGQRLRDTAQRVARAAQRKRTDPVRLYAATNMPHVFNLFASADFVFNTPKAFTDRFDPSDEMYFSGQTVRVADRLMAANFVPSITNMSLDQWSYRGRAPTCTSHGRGALRLSHLRVPHRFVQEGTRLRDGV